MRRVFPAAWLVACGIPTAEPDPDRLAYVAALEQGPAACTEIQQPRLAGECMAFAAAEVADVNLAAARAHCSAITDPTWADECGFMVCDRAAVSVEDARKCCAGAGRYSDRCIGHAVSRAVYAVLDEHPPGDEGAAWEAARGVNRDALGQGGDDRAADLYVKWLLDRVDGPTLGVGHCGTAPVHLCADVYAELVARTARTQGADPASFARRACARVVSRSRAEALGLPGWEPALDAAVQQAFQKMCRR